MDICIYIYIYVYIAIDIDIVIVMGLHPAGARALAPSLPAKIIPAKTA